MKDPNSLSHPAASASCFVDTMIEITNKPIETDCVLASVESDLAGAAVLFVGSTRKFTDENETLKLEYECYEAMALKKMEELRERAIEKWPIEKCSIVHRVGEVVGWARPVSPSL